MCDILTPQLLTFVDTIDEKSLELLGENLNQDKTLFPNGINVSLARDLGKLGIFVRTFERGGAGMSYSCSSAMLSSVAALMRRRREERMVTVDTYSFGGRSVADIRQIRQDVYEGAISASVGLVYRANIDWDGTSIGNQIRGEVNMGALVAMESRAEAELKKIRYTDFFSGKARF